MTTAVWIVGLAALAACAAMEIATRVRRRRRQAQRRLMLQTRAQRLESLREAHYMRNFWSYDGSVQEEFEE